MAEKRSGDVIDLAAERRRRETLQAKQDLDRYLKAFCEDPGLIDTNQALKNLSTTKGELL